jgi:hypothetical protein
MPLNGFQLEDMERLLPAGAFEALSHAAKGIRRLPNQISEGMRKSLQINSMNMALWQSVCVVAQIFCFIGEEELNFSFLFVDFDRKEGGDYRNDNVVWSDTPVMYVILVLQILFSVATAASVHFAIQYHLVKKQQHIHITHVHELQPETKWTVFRRVFPEIIMLLIQVPPGVDATFKEINFTGNVAVHRVRIFNALCFLRM